MREGHGQPTRSRWQGSCSFRAIAPTYDIVRRFIADSTVRQDHAIAQQVHRQAARWAATRGKTLRMIARCNCLRYVLAMLAVVLRSTGMLLSAADLAKCHSEREVYLQARVVPLSGAATTVV